MKTLMIFLIIWQASCASTEAQNSSDTEFINPPVKEQTVWNKSYSDIFSDALDLKRPKTENKGPFPISIVKDQWFTLGPSDQIAADMFIPEQYGPSPLVIIVHGNRFSKEMHQSQAEYMASWGIHVMTLNLPNEKEWLLNGFRTKKMVSMLSAVPTIMSANIDTSKIILVGHSFGGSAVTISAAQGAKVAGLVLLDPAVVSEEIYNYQKSIRVPVVLLGADATVFQSRHRSTFSKNIKSPFFEVSVAGAEHTDAQHPLAHPIYEWFVHSKPRSERRSIFTQLILESTISILENNFSYLSETIRETSKNSKIDIKIEHWTR